MEGVLSTIGKTPLVPLEQLFPASGVRFFGKLEGFNVGGSVKDRAAYGMLKAALERGEVRAGGTVVESSSGNMGIGLALACRYFGLRFICVVDPKTTSQNIAILKALGAEVDLVEQVDAVTGEFLQARLNRVHQLLASETGAYWPNQYGNPDNPRAHHQTIREIVDALEGPLDVLVLSASTCGTIRGCADFVAAQGLDTRIIAVDAAGSVIFGGERAKRLIPGHGAAIRSELYRDGMAERCLYVSDLDCVVGCRRLVAREAILAGGSSGAVVSGLAQLEPTLAPGTTCVAILPDRGERYLDTIYNDDWVRSHFGDVRHLWEAEPLPRAEATAPVALRA